MQPKEDIGIGLNAAERVTEDFVDSTFDDLATPVDEEQTVDSIMRDVRTRQSNYIHVLIQVISPPAETPAPEPQCQDPVDTVAFINQSASNSHHIRSYVFSVFLQSFGSSSLTPVLPNLHL